MTPDQEEALYDFLENVTKPFTLDDVSKYVRTHDESKRTDRLPQEIAAIIDSRNVAFKLDPRQWLSRRGCFEDVPFVIKPTKLELLNGILIPGHRCAPFANPVKLPHEYKFFWQGKKIPETSTEGPPEDFYPYYNILGEEYAPQYVARDNPENESAFNCDPFEDPPEVSIHTLDMRNIFRETSFIPGDRFLARTRDWKEGHFDLEKVDKGAWQEADLFAWLKAAEKGFKDSFTLLGPGASTEEQIAYAYWYGGKRMRDIPAYALEEFLYEKTEQIEYTTYGIETRFWFAGKDIPDSKGLSCIAAHPDRTYIENILFKVNVPISEYVIMSYIRDALFKNETDIDKVLDRIVPPSIHLGEAEWSILADYISEAMEEIQRHYTLFLDKNMGPIRQHTCELHSAVIDLAARLQKGEMDLSWLPKHTFIRLSQIQGHAANLLEDLDSDEEPPESELEAMDNSLDSMIETFDDIKEMIDEAMNNYRRCNLQLVRSGKDPSPQKTWRTLQISLTGTDVWRRAVLPGGYLLEDIHKLIQISMDWKDMYRHRFYSNSRSSNEIMILDDKTILYDICNLGISEIQYEYGIRWNIKIMIISLYQAGEEETMRCVAGNGAAPPETMEGLQRFQKILSALEGSDTEKQAALSEVGPDFIPSLFDMDKCNRNLAAAYSVEK